MNNWKIRIPKLGLPVTYAKAPKQNEIINYTLQLLPSNWTLKKNPSIHMDKAMVAIKLTDMPAMEEIEAIREKLNQVTGYTLEIQLH